MVPGIAQPQGNKTPFPFHKRDEHGRPLWRIDKRTQQRVPVLGVRMAEGRDYKAQKAFEQWRSSITAVAKTIYRGEPSSDLLMATYHFFLPMPANPKYWRAPGTPPDLDKLIRAVNDALTGVVFRNDSQIVRDGGSGKFWAPPDSGVGPHLRIEIKPI